jgi:hypothetical protein
MPFRSGISGLLIGLLMVILLSGTGRFSKITEDMSIGIRKDRKGIKVRKSIGEEMKHKPVGK